MRIKLIFISVLVLFGVFSLLNAKDSASNVKDFQIKNLQSIETYIEIEMFEAMMEPTHSVRVKKDIDTMSKLSFIKREDILSQCAGYPFSRQIKVGVMEVLGLTLDHLKIEEVKKIFYSVLWAYYALYLKNSSKYKDLELNQFEDRLNNLKDDLLYIKIASPQILEHIEFAIKYAKFIPSAYLSDEKQRILSENLKISNVKYTHLPDMHNYLISWFEVNQPQSNFEHFLSKQNQEDFNLLLKYIFSEGIFSEYDSFKFMYDDETSIELYSFIKEKMIGTSGCMWTFPTYTLFRKEVLPSNETSHEDEVKSGLVFEMGTLGIYIINDVPLKKNDPLAIYVPDFYNREVAFYKGNVDLFQLKDLESNKLLNIEIPVDNLFSKQNIKELSSTLKPYLSENSYYQISNSYINISLLSILRIDFIPSNTPNKQELINYQLVTRSKLNIYNEIKATLKYLSLLKARKGKANALSLIKDLISMQKLLYVLNPKIRLSPKQVEYKIYKNTLIMAYINTSIINKHTSILLKSFKEQALKDDIASLKKEILKKQE